MILIQNFPFLSFSYLISSDMIKKRAKKDQNNKILSKSEFSMKRYKYFKFRGFLIIFLFFVIFPKFSNIFLFLSIFYFSRIKIEKVNLFVHADVAH